MKKSGKTGKQYGIWYTPESGWDMAEPGWVTDAKRTEVALYPTERSAKRDLKAFAVHPERYEVREYRP